MGNREIYLYLGTFFAAFILEALAFKIHFYLTKKHYKIHHFTFSKYAMYLLVPLVAITLLGYNVGITAFKVFAIFAIVGTSLEWIVGWSYDRAIGQRLWTYHKYSITKYTSFLSLPLWGMCGIMFWVLAKAF